MPKERKGYRGRIQRVPSTPSRIIPMSEGGPAYRRPPGAVVMWGQGEDGGWVIFEFMGPIVPDGSTPLPNRVGTNPSIPLEARMLYWILAIGAEMQDDRLVVEVEQWQLAQQLDRSIRTVQQLQTVLQDRGLLDVERISYKRENRYILLG